MILYIEISVTLRDKKTEIWKKKSKSRQMTRQFINRAANLADQLDGYIHTKIIDEQGIGRKKLNEALLLSICSNQNLLSTGEAPVIPEQRWIERLMQ